MIFLLEEHRVRHRHANLFLYYMASIKKNSNFIFIYEIKKNNDIYRKNITIMTVIVINITRNF